VRGAPVGLSDQGAPQRSSKLAPPFPLIVAIRRRRDRVTEVLLSDGRIVELRPAWPPYDWERES
jgi:hypothetical protein